MEHDNKGRTRKKEKNNNLLALCTAAKSREPHPRAAHRFSTLQKSCISTKVKGTLFVTLQLYRRPGILDVTTYKPRGRTREAFVVIGGRKGESEYPELRKCNRGERVHGMQPTGVKKLCSHAFCMCYICDT